MIDDYLSNVADQMLEDVANYKRSSTMDDKEVSCEIGIEVHGPGITTLEQLILAALPEEWRKKIAGDLHLLQQYNNGNYRAAAKAVEKLQKARAQKQTLLNTLRAAPERAFCSKHGDPLVCLACEAEDDADPTWQVKPQNP